MGQNISQAMQAAVVNHMSITCPVVQGKENRTGIERTIRSHTIGSYCRALFLLVGYGEKYPPLHIRDAGYDT